MQDSRKECGIETRIDEWKTRSISQHQRLAHKPQIRDVANDKITAGGVHRLGDVSRACADIQYSSAFRQPPAESRQYVPRASTADGVHYSRSQAVALRESN